VGADNPAPTARRPTEFVVVLLAALLVMTGVNVAGFDRVEQRAPLQYTAFWEQEGSSLRELSWHTTKTIRTRTSLYLQLGRTAEGQHVLVHEDHGFRRHRLLGLTRAGSIEVADYDDEIDRRTMRDLRAAAAWRNTDQHVGRFAIVEPDDGGRSDMVAVRYQELVALVPAEVAAELGVGR
jgi:hypothetical protein